MSSTNFRPYLKGDEPTTLLRSKNFHWTILVTDIEDQLLEKLPEKNKNFIETLSQNCRKTKSSAEVRQRLPRQRLKKLYSIILNSGMFSNTDEALINYMNQNNDLSKLTFENFLNKFEHKVEPQSRNKAFSLWDPILSIMKPSLLKKNNITITRDMENRTLNMLKGFQEGLHLQAPLQLLNAKAALVSDGVGIVEDVAQYIVAFMMQAYLDTPVNPQTV